MPKKTPVSSAQTHAELTPRKIVAQLDRHIIGQDKAKRAVSVALRNRWRRRQLPEELQAEIYPKNILMIGPTGVGKTEIARRLAKIANAPFHKVEASKFTEIGYVGRDVESIIRDLVDLAIARLQDRLREEKRKEAEYIAEERLLELMFANQPTDNDDDQQVSETRDNSVEKLRKKLRSGKLDDREITLETHDKMMNVNVVPLGGQGFDSMGVNISEMIGNITEMLDAKMPSSRSFHRTTIKDAREIIINEELDKISDNQQVAAQAIEWVEQNGIVFLDEIDKIVGKEGGHSPDISRAGVQRDILPIVEGTTVNTKHGLVRTDHILFIAAGAFHTTKPSDLMPELQGRFPIRVELNNLDADDFVKILTETEHSLITQYKELLRTEQVELEFEMDGVKALAEVAATINDRTDNIGARRLHTVLEHLLETISFEAPECTGSQYSITPEYVHEQLSRLVADHDLSRYIL